MENEAIIGHCEHCGFRIYDSELVYKSPLGMIHVVCKNEFVDKLLGQPTLAGG